MAGTFTGAETRETDDPDDSDDSDDVVVLPWWQRPANIVTLLLATALIAGMLGWVISDAGSERHVSEVDVGFLHDMRIHHDQAVQMSQIYLARPDTDPGLQTVASTILVGQMLDAGRMVQLLRDNGAPETRDLSDPAMTWMGMSMPTDEMPGLATEAEIEAFAASSGEEADEMFVQLMTAHHEGGIEMAGEAAARGSNGEVVALAESMVVSQRSDIAEMERLLQR